VPCLRGSLEPRAIEGSLSEPCTHEPSLACLPKGQSARRLAHSVLGWLGRAPTVMVCLNGADLTEPELRQDVLTLRRRVQADINERKIKSNSAPSLIDQGRTHPMVHSTAGSEGWTRYFADHSSTGELSEK
jgi:hypothetical protein